MYRIAGVGTSLLLIAAGAVLAWAVDVDTDGVNLNTIGVILFVVGLVGLLISVIVGVSARDRTTTTIVDNSASPERVIERDRY